MPGDHVRQFAKFFTNLNPGQQREFERVMNDIQGLNDSVNLNRSADLLKRNPTTALAIPDITVTVGVRGGIVTWPALQDQFISFYEVQVDETATFPSPETIQTFTNQAVVDGLSNSVFVRVRGVRLDGTATFFSETKTIQPKLFDIEIHVDEAFYININTSPGTFKTVVGGLGTGLDYTPINEDGNSMVWGFLTGYGDPNQAIVGTPSIAVQLTYKIKESDDTVVSQEVIWRNTFGSFFDSQSVGPVIVEHPTAGRKLEFRIEVEDNNVGYDAGGNATTRSGNYTTIHWAHISAMELGIDDS